MKNEKYTVFETAWGFMGFSAKDGAVMGVSLPVATRKAAEKRFAVLEFDSGLMKDVQKAFVRYFDGEKVDFSTWPRVNAGQKTAFASNVLNTCRRIAYSRRLTYAELAKLAGRAGAARAVGTIMANNPIPLIIPCHRVLRSDGGLGGYSAEGGIATKTSLLQLESRA
jgi:methylated-DNA-[protein]-cysteine S-methyltransferase